MRLVWGRWQSGILASGRALQGADLLTELHSKPHNRPIARADSLAHLPDSCADSLADSGPRHV